MSAMQCNESSDGWGVCYGHHLSVDLMHLDDPPLFDGAVGTEAHVGRELAERSGVGGEQTFDIVEQVVGHVAEFAALVVELEHLARVPTARGDEDVVACIGDFADHATRSDPAGQ